MKCLIGVTVKHSCGVQHGFPMWQYYLTTGNFATYCQMTSGQSC